MCIFEDAIKLKASYWQIKPLAAIVDNVALAK
jgi:hypothetical protein